MKQYGLKAYTLIFLLIFPPFYLISQVTKIMGKVIDIKTQEPIPFVTIAFKGGQIGTSTDFNGEYSIEVKKLGDSLFATCLGYTPSSKKIIKNKFQVINFELAPVSMTMKEVVIKPGVNPAEIILRKIIENKKFNNKEKLDYYEYEVYNKIQFDANNISDKLERMKLLKQFKFIFDYVDTSTVNGKAYLPVFISEVLSDYYYRKSPKSSKEIIKAARTSGVTNKSIAQFLGTWYLDINIYDNFINLFDKNFVSPTANFGLGFYKYYLIDSAFIGNQWCYKIMFKPRRKQELTFTGDMWVHDTTFAVRKVNLRIAEDANIDFINDLVCSQDYEFINKQYWMLTKENFTVDANVLQKSKRVIGVYGHKSTTYRNFVFNTPAEDKLYKNPVNNSVNDDAYNKSSEYWESNRHETLDKKEKGIYKMVDSIKNVPIFRTYYDILMTIFTGYYVHNKLEWGPYFETFSFNKIEGDRFQIGARTSNKFSKTIMPEAYVAYGTLDRRFKYEGGILYMLNKNPRRDIGLYYKNDVEQLGQSQYAFYENNILASVLRKSPFNKLTMVEQYNGYYEHEWFNGFSNTINFIRRDVTPPLNTQFIFNNNEHIENYNSIITSEIRLDLRFAYKEKYLMGEFERVYVGNVGTHYPVLNIQYALGLKDLWGGHYNYRKLFGGEYNYRKLVFGLEQWFNVRTYGYSRYVLQAGKIWNTLPYPLLNLLPGNETLSFDEYSFNMMNYYEFYTDDWFSFYYTHHFDGYFLNHIPLMRRLKWREVVWAKGIVGRLNNANEQYNSLEIQQLRSEKLKEPQRIYLNPLTKPYYEVGVAIENIFKIIRIDALWRLSYLNNNDFFYYSKLQKKPRIFGLMVTLQLIL
jgi:hypothetical protein